MKQQKTQSSQSKTNKDLDSLYALLQDENDRVSISKLREKIEESNLQNECKIFMKKTANLEEDNQLKQNEMKIRLQCDYNNENDLKHIYQVMTEFTGKEAIDAQTLQKIRLGLTPEDIETMIKYANKDNKSKSVSYTELRGFLSTL